jgi:hypothetical protein
MRNLIPEVTEATVIQDFYRGSNDSAFLRAILQKAPITSEQLFYETDIYDLIGGTKSAPPAPQRDTNQQPDKHWEKRLREEVHTAGPPAARAVAHLVEECGHWTKSSTPSVRTTRTCTTPYITVETSNILSGMADRSSHYHLPYHEESLASLGSLSSRKRGGVELSHALTGRSTSYLEAMGHKKTKAQRSAGPDGYDQCSGPLPMVRARDNL